MGCWGGQAGATHFESSKPLMHERKTKGQFLGFYPSHVSETSLFCMSRPSPDLSFPALPQTLLAAEPCSLHTPAVRPATAPRGKQHLRQRQYRTHLWKAKNLLNRELIRKIFGNVDVMI